VDNATMYVTNSIVKKWHENTLMSRYGMLNKIWVGGPQSI